MVMALELLNIAVESLCNLVSPDFHPLVKTAKDAASAAVFLAISANALYWIYLVCVY
jgi:diacylglycerol kinase (ATP)